MFTWLSLYVQIFLLPLSTSALKPFLSEPDWSIYMRGDDYMNAVRKLAEEFPKVVQFEVRKEISDGYSAEVPIITFDTGHGPENKLRALFSFGEHARELITTEVALPLLRDLATRYNTLAQATDLDVMEAAARDAIAKGQSTDLDILLPMTRIKIIPMVRASSFIDD